MHFQSLPTPAPRSIRSWTIALLAILATVATAGAHPMPPHDGFPPMRRLEKALSLTAAQKVSCKARMDAVLEADKAVMEAIDGKHAELRALWTTPAPNRDVILAKLAEIEVLHGKLDIARVDAQIAMVALLTEEQRAEFTKLMAEPPRGGKRGHPGR